MDRRSIIFLVVLSGVFLSVAPAIFEWRHPDEGAGSRSLQGCKGDRLRRGRGRGSNRECPDRGDPRPGQAGRGNGRYRPDHGPAPWAGKSRLWDAGRGLLPRGNRAGAADPGRDPGGSPAGVPPGASKGLQDDHPDPRKGYRRRRGRHRTGWVDRQYRYPPRRRRHQEGRRAPGEGGCQDALRVSVHSRRSLGFR